MGHRLAGDRRSLRRLPARREEDHRRAQAPGRQKGRADGTAAHPKAKGAGKIFLRRRARRRICPAAHPQVAGGDRLAPHRRSFQRRRFREPSARHQAGDDRARARQPGRARLCGRGRHYFHSFHRRHLDGAAAALRAAAVSFRAQGAARRRGVLRAVGRVVGLRRAGAAQLHGGGGPDAALPRPARGRRGGVRCGERRGAPRHDDAGDRRRRRRHRGARLHGVRRPDARLRRRLLPAHRRHEEPPGGPAARHDAGGEHDGRRAAERDQPRAAGRRAGRRADPRDTRGLRAPARGATRLLPDMKPVLVVGAGPVGLATALSLAHQGVPVQVIEAEPALTLDQRAGSFHPPTLEMLAPFGVTEAMHEVGIKVPRWQIRDRRQGVIVEWDLGLIADLTPYPYRFHLEQHRLTPILYEKLKAFPHAQVRFSTGFVDARQSGDSVTVSTTSGELKTPWLVGCDGGRSTVRKHLGMPFDGFTWPERFVVISTLADFAQQGFTSNAYVADPREWAAVFHMPGLWRLAFPVHPEENEADVLADEAVEARMQRFVLAGDAAHLNNPLGAFGLNGGLHDAILLAEYLGRVWRGEADASLLDLYVRQRRTANVEFVQTQSIGNKKMLEEADPAAREEAFAAQPRLRRDKSGSEPDFQIIAEPPSTTIVWPVMKAASSLARKLTAPTRSSGVSARWIARVILVISPCLRWAGSFITPSERVNPGASAFTVMPSLPSSRASPRVIAITAPLLAT